MLYIYNILLYSPYDNTENIQQDFCPQAGTRLFEKGIGRKNRCQFQTVGYLEREEYNPSLDLAFRISECFGLPIDLIFSTEPLKPLSQELLERKKREEQ